MAKILTIRLPESVYESVEEAANEEGLLVSEYLRYLIRDAFEPEEEAGKDEGEPEKREDEEPEDEPDE